LLFLIFTHKRVAPDRGGFVYFFLFPYVSLPGLLSAFKFRITFSSIFHHTGQHDVLSPFPGHSPFQGISLPHPVSLTFSPFTEIDRYRPFSLERAAALFLLRALMATCPLFLCAPAAFLPIGRGPVLPRASFVQPASPLIPFFFFPLSLLPCIP